MLPTDLEEDLIPVILWSVYQVTYLNFPSLSGGDDYEPEIPEALAKTKQKNLYESFVKERDREERGLNEDNPSKPRVGHTVYVYGYGISEELLR